MIKICFVCTGNTCRSVMAEKLLVKELRRLKLDNIKVDSRGIYAKGDNIAENAKTALKVRGVLARNRKSRRLGRLDSKLLYITMEASQKPLVCASRVATYGELVGGGDVPDPYGGSLEVYLKTADILEGYSKILAEKLFGELCGKKYEGK